MLLEEPNFPFQSNSPAPERWCKHLRIAPCFLHLGCGHRHVVLLLRGGCYAAEQRGNEDWMWKRLTNTAEPSQVPLQQQGPLTATLTSGHPVLCLMKCNCSCTLSVFWDQSTFVSGVWTLSLHMPILKLPKVLLPIFVAGSLFLGAWNPAP